MTKLSKPFKSTSPNKWRHSKPGNMLQFFGLMALVAVLGFFFYFTPQNGTYVPVKSAAKTSGRVLNNEGIGGGSIIGDCTAGKKNLPIYCVDMESKTKQAGNNSDSTDENNSDNSNESSSTDSSSKKYISLSFDAAWGADDTVRILDILDKYNVKVTFFMTGGWVDSFPDMVKEIYSRGHDLGNHSQNHKQMSKLDVAGQQEELQSVGRKVKELTDYDMFLFRPPYGDYNSTLITTAYGINYYPIQWTVDSLDWKDYGVDNIIKTVTQHKALGNGAIILMHNGAKFTADALETVITNLQNQGYTFVPISELIIRENFHMDGTGKQIAD